MSQLNDPVKMKIATIVAHLENIEAEKEAMKLVIQDIVANHGEDKKKITKYAKAVHKNKVRELQEECNSFDEFIARYAY